MVLTLVLGAALVQPCLDAVRELDEKRPIDVAVRACSALLPSPCAVAFREGTRGVCTQASTGPERRAAFRDLLAPAAKAQLDEVMIAFDALDRRRDFPFSTPCLDGRVARGPFADKDSVLEVLRRGARTAKCPPGELMLERGYGLRMTISTAGKVCRLRGEARTEAQRCFARHLERLVFPPVSEGTLELDFPLNVDSQ